MLCIIYVTAVTINTYNKTFIVILKIGSDKLILGKIDIR